MIVIKDGKNFAHTYASLAFDKWGTPIQEDIHIIENDEDLKKYNFPKETKIIDSNNTVEENFDDYCNMIENTLWIFNNDPIKIRESEVYTTGGGINWMFHNSDVFVYDISKVQCNFIKSLLLNWDGTNYGQFVFDFILKNKIRHFHVNLKESQDSNNELIKNKEEFIKQINNNFQMLVDKYKKEWVWNPTKITVKNENLLDMLKNKNINKFLLSNILNFKYYYVKNYIQNCNNILAPSTKVFLKSFVNKIQNQYSDPPCEKIELNVPVADIYHEIIAIRKYLVTHRADSGMNWKSFCIHGQSYKRTKEKSAYKDFLGYRWTNEAVENMPKTIAWLKSLDIKNFARVRVMCLEPWGFINLHRDQTVSKLGPINVAITNPKNCEFWLENYGKLEFEPGVSFRLNLVNYHCVINNSNIPRYHIIIHSE